MSNGPNGQIQGTFFSVDPARASTNLRAAKGAMKAGQHKTLAGNLKQTKLPKSSSRRTSRSL